ncbi:capsid protein [Bosea sp. 685]|uniref:capsid protein n=1 Tax=Bosea sp. 685 TaxID=3080057 RepID=UPI002892F609|nr:capsid protein [Bosea sp. 685]WNJ89164.1 capsid protein [Bosea sp. 685]
MATSRPFIVDAALSAIAIKFSNPDVSLIADRVLPRRPVGGEKFKWLKFPVEDSFTVPNTLVGRKGRPNQIEVGATEEDSSVLDYGLDDLVPNSDVDAARQQREAGFSVYDPEARATEVLTDLVLLDREIRVAAKVFDLNTYAASQRVTLSGTSQFSDIVNSDPINVINGALDSTFVMRPNKMVIGQLAWTKVRSHPHIVNAVKGGNLNKGNATREQVAELFELQEIIVGSSFVNTARKGQTAAMSRVWGKHISLIYQNSVAGPDAGMTFGYTAQYGNRLAGRIPDSNIGLQGGAAIRVGERVREIVSAPSVAYFIQNAVA